MMPNCAIVRSPAEEALVAAFPGVQGPPGALERAAVARLREDAFAVLEKAACRTGASRNGNTPTCAR